MQCSAYHSGGWTEVTDKKAMQPGVLSQKAWHCKVVKPWEYARLRPWTAKCRL